MLLLAMQPAAAITIQVDYTYDTTNFFGSGNPQGAAAGTQAHAAMDAAATYFSNILNDTFSAIQTPPPYHSSVSDGVVTWTWQENFANPTTGSQVTVNDPTIPADRYVIYAGARDLTGTTAGVGAVGGYGWSSQVTGTNSFSPNDINQINATTASFQNAVEKRGEASGFAAWGGAISFDTSARTWYFDHTTSPSGNVTDFYSVAIHELAHSLGFGQHSNQGTSVWDTLVSATTFVGPNATAQNAGTALPLSADKSHWAIGTTSVIYGTSTSQETAMDPDLLNGTRKKFTTLDAAALTDIGWELLYADYNSNGFVDAGDYPLWRKRSGQSVTIANDVTPGSVDASDYSAWRARFANVPSAAGSGATLAGSAVPEPAGAVLAIVCSIVACVARRKRVCAKYAARSL
jgi:hypothetical protein